MPTLSWNSKHIPSIEPVKLIADSRYLPQPHRLEERPANRLIWGDNLAIMTSLLENYEGKIDLIYADPPFFTNRRYRTRVGRGEDSRKPEEWKMAEGYADSWKNLEEYLDMLYPRLDLMHRLLSPTGTLYLHLDWHANSYARLLLDEIFGEDRLLNEIVWTYHGPSPIRSAFNRKHDTILSYTKSKDYTFNVDDVREPYNPNTVKTFDSSRKAGFGKVPDLERGKVPEDWWYFPVVARLHSERTGYPTQKPAALLERIIKASSNPGELVADFFCGSGTTLEVANRLGRKFIGTDNQWRAVCTSRGRLLAEGDAHFEFSHTEKEKIVCMPFPPEIDAVVEGDMVQLCGAEEWIQRIEYWEAGISEANKIFHPGAWAVRPLRKGKLKTVLEKPAISGDRMAIRLLTTNGDVFEKVI